MGDSGRFRGDFNADNGFVKGSWSKPAKALLNKLFFFFPLS